MDPGFSVRASTPDGSPDVTPARRSFFVDTQAPSARPVLVGTGGPQAGRYTGAVGITAAGDDPAPGSGVESIRCVLDPPSPPAGFSDMPPGCATSTSTPGDHVVYAAARDAAGNTTSTPGVARFSIDDVPDTVITSGPNGLTSSLPVSFGFRSTVAGATLECRMDGGAFAPCIPPQGYGFLPDGTHVFEARAVGPTGVVDPTPATRTFRLGTASTSASCSGSVPFGGAAALDLKFSLGGVSCVALKRPCPAGSSCTLRLTAGVTDADGKTPWTSRGEVELKPGAGATASASSRCASTPEEHVDVYKDLSVATSIPACAQTSSTSILGPATATAQCRVERPLYGSGYHARGTDSLRRHTCAATLETKPARVLGVTLSGVAGATTVPGAGALAMTGMVFTGRAGAAAAKPAFTLRTRPRAAGVVRFSIRLRGSAARTLRRRGKLRVRLTLTFTPVSGRRTVSRQLVTITKPAAAVTRPPEVKGPARCQVRPKACARRGGRLVPR